MRNSFSHSYIFDTILSFLDSVLEIKDIAVMMIFPYFLESHVTEAFPSLKLMDYKVGSLPLLQAIIPV